MENVLQSFDLTKNEIKVYLCLLESGSALAGELTSKTGIHRRNVYDSLERLIKKGLVGYVALNNKKYFRAAKPDHFFSLLEQEKGSLQEKEENLKKILPKLSLLSGISCKNQRVSVFEGKKGIITILEDVLKCAKENLVFSTPEIQIIKDYLAHFHNKRVKAKIFDKIITNKSDLKRAKALAKLPFTEIKVMDKEFDSPIAINVYSNKVGILILAENPIGILIEDKVVHDTFKKYFNVMWMMAEDV